MTKRFEYDVQRFALVEKWDAKKQAEALANLKADLDVKGSQGWELIGLQAFKPGWGSAWRRQRDTTLTLWKREQS